MDTEIFKTTREDLTTCFNIIDSRSIVCPQEKESAKHLLSEFLDFLISNNIVENNNYMIMNDRIIKLINQCELDTLIICEYDEEDVDEDI